MGAQAAASSDWKILIDIHLLGIINVPTLASTIIHRGVKDVRVEFETLVLDVRNS